MKQILHELGWLVTFFAPFVICALWMEGEEGWAVFTGIVWLLICGAYGWSKHQNDEPRVGPM